MLNVTWGVFQQIYIICNEQIHSEIQFTNRKSLSKTMYQKLLFLQPIL